MSCFKTVAENDSQDECWSIATIKTKWMGIFGFLKMIHHRETIYECSYLAYCYILLTVSQQWKSLVIISLGSSVVFKEKTNSLLNICINSLKIGKLETHKCDITLCLPLHNYNFPLSYRFLYYLGYISLV